MKTSPLAFLVFVIHLVAVTSFAGAQCEPGLDCNGNGILDSCDIADFNSDDCDGDGVPDECQMTLDPSLDCNQDLILDSCEGTLEEILSSPNSAYGESLDMTSSWLAIGSPETTTSGVTAGAVHLYRNIGSRWISAGTLHPPVPSESAEFGHSVAITDDILVVGAPGSGSGSSQDEGAAYIYRRVGLNWTLEQQLEPAGDEDGAEFGISVAAEGDIVAVGAWYAQATSDSGAVYLYSHDGLNWNLDQLIESPDSSGDKHFAASVELSGDILLVTDPRADAGPEDDAGAVYAYKAFSATLWAFLQKITAPSPIDGGQFGHSIDVLGDQLLVGAPNSGSGSRGEVHLFTRGISTYSSTAMFSGEFSNNNMGKDVALNADGIIAGAWRATGNIGQIVVFQKDASGSYQRENYVPTGALSGDRVGQRVATAGRWVAGVSVVDNYVAIDRLIDLPDCDENGVDDPCDIFLGNAQDCNQDGKPDSCQIADGELADCNLDGIADSCQLEDGTAEDCNMNGVIDSCDIDSGTSSDCNHNQIPDDCESDCNQNDIEDSCEIALGLASDCNGNDILDECDLSAGTATDCNNNSVLDSCDLADGNADDCDANGILDVCDILASNDKDCNSNQILDSCEIQNGTALDCNNNNKPDICDVAFQDSPDCDNDLIPDECELQDGSEEDCNSNNQLDSCDIVDGTDNDCDGNEIPDVCDITNGAVDCNENSIPDICEQDVDTELPVIDGLPGNVSISAFEGECAATFSWDAPTLTDNCGIASEVVSHNSGDWFSVGDTIVTCTVTDVSGNVNEQMFVVTVVDDELPEIINGPANIIVDNDPGSCEALITWDEPTATDNCGIADLSCTFDPNTSFPTGTTTVTYTCTDVNGKVANHSFDVTVNDADLPTIQGLPGPVFVNSNPGTCSAQISWPEPQYSDNCPGATATSNRSSGSEFSVGTTLVTYTVLDASGNSAQASFELTVIDNEMPTISNVPADVTLTNDEELCGAAYSWEEPAITDNCGAPALTSSLQSGQVFPVGSTFVSLTVDDGNSNIVETGFTVTVIDDTAPLISRMPENIVIDADLGSCETQVDWEEPEAADNCGVSTLVANHVPGLYSVGEAEVIYTAQDINGNISIESFTITVLDNQLPEIAGLPVDLETDNLAGLCGANLAWPAPSASDNCGVETIESSHQPGSEFPVGITTVVYTVTDINGNTTEDSFLVTIHDVDSPEIDDMPGDIVVSNDEGDCGALVSWQEPAATDNCVVTDLSSDHVNGGSFPVGTTVVTYTATDGDENQYSETFAVTVLDQEAPVLVGLVETVTFTNTEGLCSGLATWDAPSGIDNCGETTITSSHEPGWSFEVGNTLVTYTVTDSHGNSSNGELIVTITDDEAPTFVSAPDFINATTDPGTCTTFVGWDIPEVDDNCQIFSLSTSNLRDTEFGVGVTEVTYVATDIHGNTAEHSFVITVSDDEMPVIEPLPEVIAIDTESGLCTAAAHWEDPTPTDNCGILSFESSHQSGDIFELGTTTVTVSTTDIHFNVTTETFDVVVTDAELPEFTSLPADIQLIAEAGICSAVAEWEDATGTDNCGVLSITSNRQSGEHFDVGTTLVTFTLEDVNGNSVEHQMSITVTDLELPVITNLPARVTITTEPGICMGTTSWLDPLTSDNCGVESLTTDVDSGAMLPIGEIPVTYTVTDVHGNQSSQTFIVTVEDQESPQITNVPADITQTNDSGECGAIVTWAEPQASDNCEVGIFTSTHSSGSVFPVGVTTVTLVAIDNSANETTMSFDITILDEEAPVLSGVPGNLEFTNDLGFCGAVVEWDAPTSSDNCDTAPAIESNHSSGELFPVGETLVSYTTTDSDGNSSSQSFTVTVSDDESPQLVSMPMDIQQDTDRGVCGAVVEWASPTASDNCGAGIPTADYMPGQEFPVGTTVVTYMLDDIHGNSTMASFAITITDTELPEFTSVPMSVSITTDLDACGAIVEWAAPEAEDACGTGDISVSHSSGDLFPVGTTTVELSVTDNNNNTSTTSFTISVTDNQAPEITGVPASFTVFNDHDQCGAMVMWNEASVSDNCEIDSFGSDVANNSFFEVGETLVTYTALDENGNSSSADFVVTVIDNQIPGLEMMPENIAVSTDPNQCSAVVSWDEPQSVDNCGPVQSTTSSHLPGDTFLTGSTTVTYNTIDIHGNQYSDSFMVTVTDDEDPVIIDLPQDITIGTEIGLCSTTVSWTDATASDNCQADIESDIQPNTVFDLGTTTVTYTAVDPRGNSVTGSFNVTVIDDEDPVLAQVPGDITLSNDTGACGAVVSWEKPTASDNCQISAFESSSESGEFYPVGTTEVTYTLSDEAGNLVSASFTILVIDDEDPVLDQIPADITVSNESGSCGAVVEWLEPSVSDNCHADIPSPSSENGGFYPVGTTEISYTVTDTSGNSVSASFMITVNDVENPVISNLSGDITVNTDLDSDHAEVSWSAPIVTDNCDQSPVLILSHQSGSDFPIGTTVVSASVTDSAGNTTAGSFEVTVIDNQDPEILNLSSSITVSNDANECGAVVTWPAHIATDNSGEVSLTVSSESGTLFPIGTTTVTVTAEDGSGNTVSGQFTVTVNDTQDPILLGTRIDLTSVNDPGVCGAEVTWSAFGVVDNCSATLDSSHESGDFFPVGETEVVLTLTDSSGNTVLESFIVTVTDEQNPTVIDPSDLVVEAAHVTCDATIDIPRLVVIDNCSVASITNNYNGTANASGTYPLGDTLVVWTIVDASGNEVSVDQLITVNVDQTDCNDNGAYDVCEVASGAASDCNSNGIPDDCETDCNANGIPDDCDIAAGSSLDTNGNGIPDECETQFQRGDVNVSGSIDVTDPIFVLQYWIGSGPTPTCLDSADINDDEQIDVSDTISLLMYLFQASAPPAAPFGTCGIDPDGLSGLSCESYANCP